MLGKVPCRRAGCLEAKLASFVLEAISQSHRSPLGKQNTEESKQQHHHRIFLIFVQMLHIFLWPELPSFFSHVRHIGLRLPNCSITRYLNFEASPLSFETRLYSRLTPFHWTPDRPPLTTTQI